MKKQSLIIIGANLAIVALLAISASVLVNKGSKTENVSDTRSKASSNTVSQSSSKDDSLEISLGENEKDLNAIVNGTDQLADDEFPQLNPNDFE